MNPNRDPSDSRRFAPPPPMGEPIPLSQEYLDLVWKEEDVLQNRNGADKSWVFSAYCAQAARN